MRDLGVRISLVTRIFGAAMMLVPALATALVYGVGGQLAISDDPHRRHPARARHPAAAAARPAPGALQRPDRRDDRAGQLRAGLRGARPALADPGEAGRGGAARRRLPARVRPRRVHLPARRRGLAGLARGGRARRVPRPRAGAPRHLVRGRARPDGRAGRPVGRRQDHDHPPGRPALRRRRRRGPGRRPRRPRRDPAVAGGRRRLRHPGRPHVPRHDPGQPALRPPGRQRPRGLGRARGRPDRARWSAACPTASTPSSATAATGSPAASASGWPSPGCCSRRPRSSSSTRRPPTSTPSPRPPSSAPSTPRSRAAPRWSSRTGSRRSATPTRSWSSTAAGSSSPAPTPSCSRAGGLYADLYRTQFVEDVPA